MCRMGRQPFLVMTIKDCGSDMMTYIMVPSGVTGITFIFHVESICTGSDLKG